jgi:putative membrane protein
MEVSSDESLSQSTDAAVRHYRSLFKLPSLNKALLLLGLLCVVGALLSGVFVFRAGEKVTYGILLGLSLFLITFSLDCALSRLVLNRDPIYDLRRTTMLSVFCWAIWFFFIFIGTIAGVIVGFSWWIRLCLVGFSAVLIFRLIVFNSTSFLDRTRLTLVSLLPPCLNVIPFVVVWMIVGYQTYLLTLQRLLFFPFSLALSVALSYLFLHFISDLPDQTLGVPGLSLFKAFLLSWIVDFNVPLEELLERLGRTQNVELSLFRFDSASRKVGIIIPSIHPGPFKNVGSSTLPYVLKETLEKRYGCLACVPHGLFGHELDLASRAQTDKVAITVADAFDFVASGVTASPLVVASDGLASASCQIFDSAGFVSVTLAPNTTEDIPQELGLCVRQEAEKLGLTCCAVVNAHNSIDGSVRMPQALSSLCSAAASCLTKTNSRSRSPFEVGASSVLPDFGLEEGMGYGGITVVAFRVNDQTAAYVVIDGNNIVSGLREKILSALKRIGIDTGEVFSTDTHSVSGLVLGERGYHPIGEAMSHEKLINSIEQAAASALASLEPARAGFRMVSVPNVRVIGRERLESLSLLTDKGLRRAKQAIIPVCFFAGLFLMLFLLFA